MSSARPNAAAWLNRLLLLTGLAGLAAITLQDRGASLMYAWPWSLCYWAAVLVPPLALLWRALDSGAPLRWPAPPWLGLTGAALAVLLAAAATSPYRSTSFLWAATPVAGLAAFLLLHDWLQTAPTHPARLARWSGFAAGGLMLASAGYWLVDLASLTRDQIFSATVFEMRNAHPLGHSNYTAGLALLSLPWLAETAMRQRGRPRFLAGFATGLALLMLFTSGSRGGLLGLAALGVTALAGARLGWKRFLLLAGIAVIAAGALALANPRIRHLLGPADPAAAPNLSNVQRHAMLDAGWQMGRDRPWLGWGLGTTPLVYPRYRATLAGGAENVLQLHSTPVELWAGLGGAGVLLLGGFVLLAARGWQRAPTAAAALAGYGVFALTDYQLDVPVFALAIAALAAQLAPPAPAPAGPRLRRGLAGAILAALGLMAFLGATDPTPRMNADALVLARTPAQSARAIALLRESLALNPDQEIAHFNLGWLLLVPDPTKAERHFRAAAQLVPDKGGVYFGLGLACLNQGRNSEAAHAFALECLNDPRFLASPWWQEPAIATARAATQEAFGRLAARAGAAAPAGTWLARQASLVASLAPRVGIVSPGPETHYRRERLGYPVLMRNLDLAPPLDLYDVREDPRFPDSVPFELPAKGWLPAPLLRKLLDAPPASLQ